MQYPHIQHVADSDDIYIQAIGPERIGQRSRTSSRSNVRHHNVSCRRSALAELDGFEKPQKNMDYKLITAGGELQA